jgi:hypothetical protein
MDGQDAAKPLGTPGGNDIHVGVIVEDLDERADKPMAKI